MLYYTETLLHKTGLFSDSWVHFYASCFSRTCQSVLSNPLIVIKTRFEVVGFKEYNGMFDAVRQITMKEGLSGFFTGLKISLIRDVPFSGVFYPIYHFFKTYYAIMLGIAERGEKNGSVRAMNLALLTSLSSFSANIVSCVITHPLDLIRTRVYFQFYNLDQGQHYQSITQAFLKIY